MLSLFSPKRCGIKIQTNGRATPLDPGPGGWVGKGRAEKAEETSDAEIDLNFDVVQMGSLPETCFWGGKQHHLLLEEKLSVMNMVFVTLKLRFSENFRIVSEIRRCFFIRKALRDLTKVDKVFKLADVVSEITPHPRTMHHHYYYSQLVSG